MHRFFQLVILPAAFLATLVEAAIAAQPRGIADKAVAQAVQQVADSAVKAAQAGDWETARRSADAAMNLAVAYAAPDRPQPFVDAAFTRRLVYQLFVLPADQRKEQLAFLTANPKLAQALAFSVVPQDDVASVYRVLDGLHDEFGKDVAEFANLAVAIAVVHDRPLQRQVNENSVSAPDPLDIFDYFTANSRQMVFDIKDLPVDLLIYVTDTTESPDQMTWALKRYRGERNVGNRYSEVAYDYDKLARGAPRGRDDYCMETILRSGGVCADQAYFAASVGKAIGVPTAYTYGRSSTMAHAWLGYLESTSKTAWWNFDVGRYADYVAVRGEVRDPQTGQSIPDSYLHVQAESFGATPQQRYAAVALADAALWISGSSYARPTPPTELKDRKVREPSEENALAMVDGALDQSVGCLPAWTVLRNLAEGGKLTLAQKREWVTAIGRHWANDFPDFAADLLVAIVRMVDDIDHQHPLWNQAFGMFRGRRDLQVTIRMQQAQMWEAAGDVDSAADCYEEVVTDLANASPMVVQALSALERLSKDRDLNWDTIGMYEQARKQLKRPDIAAKEFVVASSWYQANDRLATLLEEDGRGQEAARIRRDLRTFARESPAGD